MTSSPADGKPRPRVFVVEDEAIIAMLIEDMLDAGGYEVAAVAGRLDAALAAMDVHAFDVAIVDVNIGGETSYPVADRLRQRGIPFAFVTGYGAGGVAAGYASLPVLQKPFRAEDLTRMLGELLEASAQGRVARPSS